MADPTPPSPQNGNRYVSRYEWDAHTMWAVEAMKEIKAQVASDCQRIDRLESKWDRYAGPVVFLLVAMGAVATAASILSAIVAMNS